jgi:hypothetical protein
LSYSCRSTDAFAVDQPLHGWARRQRSPVLSPVQTRLGVVVAKEEEKKPQLSNHQTCSALHDSLTLETKKMPFSERTENANNKR